MGTKKKCNKNKTHAKNVECCVSLWKSECENRANESEWMNKKIK